MPPPYQPNYAIVTSSIIVDPGTVNTKIVSCPDPGTQMAISGGVDLNETIEQLVESSIPWPPGVGGDWYFAVYNGSAQQQTFAVYIVCANKS